MRPGGATRVPPPLHVPVLGPEHLDERSLSIAVFGPGRGEAILVRLPDGKVGVVDGCREPDEGNAEGRGDPVRELLDKLAARDGNAAGFRLEFVCLTHPHDDHYAGLGRLLRAFEGRVDHVWTVEHANPRFMDALLEWTRTTRGGRVPVPDDVSLAGLHRIIEEIHRARAQGRAQLKRLCDDRLLLERTVGQNKLEIWSCGPADGDLDQAEKDVFKALGSVRYGERVSAESFDANRTSGALLLQWGAAGILLGGDLLRGTGPHSGWQLARRQIKRDVQVVNVAHHASEEAHDEALWEQMRPALALVTPFKKGCRRWPPRPNQISVLARSSVVVITSPPKWDGERLPPQPMHPRSSPIRSFEARNDALDLVPSGRADAIRNAVAVSMDALGNITRLVLAGDADIYLAPDEIHAGAPAP